MPRPLKRPLHYLITGGAGFLGIHLIKRLLKQKQQITVLDRHDLPETDILTQIKFIKGNVRDFRTVDQAMSGVDVVIHAAAALPLEDPDTIKSTTIKGTRNVLRSANKHNVKRVIYVSSTAVYGVPEKHPIEETDPLVGVGPYGEAKIEAEKICLRYRKRGMNVPIVRPKTFVGTERLGVFQILFNWVRLGKRIPVIGSGNNRYQLLEVEDLVDAILMLATSPRYKKVNQTFNVGAEQFGTVRQDLQALFDHAGTGSQILPVPSMIVKPTLRLLESLNLSPLYRWVYETADKDSFVSIDKIKQELGWRPRYSNADSLIHAYDWYIQNYQEYEHQSGTTHRVGWDQKALSIVKRFL